MANTASCSPDLPKSLPNPELCKLVHDLCWFWYTKITFNSSETNDGNIAVIWYFLDKINAELKLNCTVITVHLLICRMYHACL